MGTLKKTACAAAALTLLSVTGLAPLVNAETVEVRSISTSGTGMVSHKPDTVRVTVGVDTREPTVEAALAANNKAMQAVIKAIRANGVPQKHIQTSQFSVHPQYRYNNRTRKNELEGFQVSNRVNVKLKKLDRLGKLLTAVTKSGSNQIQGVNFYIEETSKLLDEAREKVIADARRKAEVLAKAADSRVGKVIQINEGASYQPRPRAKMRMAEAALADGASSVPIASGEQQLSVSVSTTWLLE